MERTPAAGGSRGVSQYGPIAVETRGFRRPVEAVPYPTAKMLLVRDGEGTITHGERALHVRRGDFVLVRPNAACGGTPEPVATVSTIYAEPEFVFDKWRWQHSPFFPSSESVHALGRVYAKVIRARLPEADAAAVAELYDELHSLLAQGFDGFHHADATFARLLAIVTPHLRDESVPLTGTLHRPLHQATTPTRPEVATVIARIRANLAEHWTIEALAREGTHLVPALAAPVRGGDARKRRPRDEPDAAAQLRLRPRRLGAAAGSPIRLGRIPGRAEG